MKSSVRLSSDAGWNRAFAKYSPSKETTMSPIKASQANLVSVLLNDQYVEVYVWVANMSEQHFYDNAFLMLSYNKGDPKNIGKVLRRGFAGVDLEFFNHLSAIIPLGTGAFGAVYSGLDRKTNQRYAIKHIRAQYKTFRDHTANLLNYLFERNTNIRAMDSPFVIKLYYSFQVGNTRDLFLVSELAIGDLSGYIRTIVSKCRVKVSNMLLSKEKNIIQNLFTNEPEAIELGLVYIFEIFCGLDFLASCNIIHHDIKPENILISESLHLKIGDFGIACKTRTIHRKTNMILVKADDIDTSERSNFKTPKQGTIDYLDFESHLRMIDDDVRQQILNDKDVYDNLSIRYDDEVIEPTFLVDTWAAGIIAVMLLFRGINIFNPLSVEKTSLPEIPKTSIALFLINMIGRKSIYKRYIEEGLINGGGTQFEELMGFIVSIFRPRDTRCESYIAEKTVYYFGKIRKKRYIDMDKFERIVTFTERRLNRHSVHLHVIPEIFRAPFESKKKPKYKYFQQLLKEIREDKTKKTQQMSAIALNPGTTINFFT